MRENITPSASGWKYAEYRMSKNQMKEKVGASKIIGLLIHDRPVYVLCKNYSDDTEVHMDVDDVEKRSEKTLVGWRRSN